MKPAFRLSIPTPCKEKWSNLLSVDGGGFCDACQKTVIDFTGLGDVEIINQISNKGGKVCGRFRPGQLTHEYRSLPVNTVRPGLSLMKAGVIGIMVAMFSAPAAAQVKNKKQKTEVVFDKQIRHDSATKSENDTHWVSGVVRDKLDNLPIPGVNVVLKGSAVGTATDVDGKFSFPIPLNKGDVLIISFIGYISKEYKVGTGAAEVISLDLEMSYDIMGEVAVEGLYTPKATRWSRIKNWF